MKLGIQRTDRLRRFEGRDVRIWHGTTETGAPCDVLVVAIVGPDSEEERERFEAELADPGVPHVPLCRRQRTYQGEKARKVAH